MTLYTLPPFLPSFFPDFILSWPTLPFPERGSKVLYEVKYGRRKGREGEGGRDTNLLVTANFFRWCTFLCQKSLEG
jgi:hypothetical protein